MTYVRDGQRIFLRIRLSRGAFCSEVHLVTNLCPEFKWSRSYFSPICLIISSVNLSMNIFFKVSDKLDWFGVEIEQGLEFEIDLARSVRRRFFSFGRVHMLLVST